MIWVSNACSFNVSQRLKRTGKKRNRLGRLVQSVPFRGPGKWDGRAIVKPIDRGSKASSSVASPRTRCLEKTGRDCESRPNSPPTWSRFDMKNIAQPTNEIKKDFWRQGQGSCLYSKSLRRLNLGLILDDEEED